MTSRLHLSVPDITLEPNNNGVAVGFNGKIPQRAQRQDEFCRIVDLHQAAERMAAGTTDHVYLRNGATAVEDLRHLPKSARGDQLPRLICALGWPNDTLGGQPRAF